MKFRAFVLPLLLLYPIYAGVMFGKQEQILFPGSSDKHYAMKGEAPSTGRLVELPAPFGKLRLFYQAASSTAGSRPAILYTHGNFECIQDSFALVRPLVDAGADVLQLEFPGFCGADGDTTFANVVAAESLAYDWLVQQPGVDPARIVAMGYSIGGGGAGELTRSRPVRALVLMSTYTSIEDMAHRLFLPGILVRYPFDNRARVREFAGPVFLEHGRRDNVIPFAMGQELARTKPGSEFVALDCGHDNCQFDHSLFASRLPTWLAANGVLAPRNE
jgi:pimeloyl-ACP methyl ester carboxylesterase